MTFAQKQQITIEEIYENKFRTERLEALRSMNNGKHYTVLTRTNGSVSAIDKYDYKTQQKIETIVSSSDAKTIPVFSSYSFSDNERQILLATEVEPIFRHSRLGIYYIYDTTSKTIVKIADNKIQEPTLSPNGSHVAYVYDNNIYVMDVVSKETKQLTSDGIKNKIINGVTDWVYEEEFAFVRAFEWNSDGSKIAFLRFDETEVPEFSMDIYGTALYQKQNVFKYPKAGESNAIV